MISTQCIKVYYVNKQFTGSEKPKKKKVRIRWAGLTSTHYGWLCLAQGGVNVEIAVIHSGHSAAME